MTSGLPSLEWPIDRPAHTGQIREKLSSLEAAEAQRMPPFGAYTLKSNSANCGLPEYIWVFDGVIQTTDATGNIRFFKDQKGLRKYLDELMTVHIETSGEKR